MAQVLDGLSHATDLRIKSTLEADVGLGKAPAWPVGVCHCDG